MLNGCSSSTAAPLQKVPDHTQPTASLAPREDAAVSDNPIRIPEGRKNPPVVVAKSSTAPSKQQEAEQADDSIQAVDYETEQDLKQDKSVRNNRKNGGRQDGRQSDGKQRSDKITIIKKSGDDSKKPATEQSKPAAPVIEAVSAETTPAPTGNTPVSTEPTSVTPPNVIPASAVPMTAASPAAFTVTYGSSSSSTSRNYKKPSQPSNLPSWFTENDKDGDGQLTMNEWPSDRFEEFSKYDRNGDGIITIEEAMRTVPKVVATAPPAGTAATTPASGGSTAVTSPPASTTPASPTSSGSMNMSAAAPAAGKAMSAEEATRSVGAVFFPMLDSNKDGFLDAQEIEKSRSIKNVDWKKYDVNKDGKLDKNEAIALFMAEGANFQRGMGGGGPGGGWNSDERTKTMFNNMDKNKTGKITKEQLPAMWQDRFGELDTNKDGFVDFEEFKTNFPKLLTGRGGPRVNGGRGRPGRWG